MKLAIMQPYFFPYIGYFQLAAVVDTFLVYDNIKYTKKGWINRNRILQSGKDATFSLPLKKDSDYLDVRERRIASDFDRDRLINQVKETYRRAPYFAQTLPLVEQVVRYEDDNLFHFLHHSIGQTFRHLNMATEIRVSSGIAIDHSLKGQEKVLALCKAMGADTYINPIGGRELYSKDAFREKGVELSFIQSRPFEYPQFGDPFVPWLSIIDVMMFNSGTRITERLNGNYDLV